MYVSLVSPAPTLGITASKLQLPAEPLAMQVPRLSSTVLVLALAPASDFAPALASNLYKVLFIQRSRSSGFMAGAHVFPGGLLDSADAATSWQRQCKADGGVAVRVDKGDSLPLRVCALRELFEETGLLLARPAAAASTPDICSHPHTFASVDAQRAGQKACSEAASTFLQLLTGEQLQLEPEKLAPWRSVL